jgi:hypothetical protein
MTSHFFRRTGRRTILRCAVYYSNERFHASGRTGNLSRTGGCVEGTEPVRPGMRLSVLVIPPDPHDSIWVQGATVRWCRGTMFGIELTDIPLGTTMRLARLVTSQGPSLWASLTEA